MPKNWAWCRLGEIGHWAAGSTPSRKKTEYYNKGSIPWLKTGDLNDGYINNTAEFITDFALQKCSLRLNPIGSVLIAMYGATIGKLGILNIEATTNQACCACVPYLGVNNKFLFFYLYTQKRILQEKAEGGAQPNISKEKLCNFLFPLPPLAEQQRIVEKIEELLVWVEQLEQNKTELKTYLQQTKAKVLDEAIHGKLVPQNPDDEPASVLLEKIRNEQKAIAPKNKKTLHNEHYGEESFPIPKNWAWCRLGEVCKFLNGYAFNSKDYNTHGIPLVRISNIQNNKIELKDAVFINRPIDEKFTIKKGDLLIAMSGATTGKMGNYTLDENAYLNQRIGNIRVRNENVLYPIYRDYFMQTKSNEILKMAYGGAQPNISGEIINSIYFPLPPLEEQKRIVQKIEKIFAELEIIEELLDENMN
ncbi:restriction endonuclease subunit S [Riemerella columbina]|nr:restriction endonuclease subunit S [Riemerella columbina]WKS96109.1 restriction endonuclease subunit S [Riemerella columbina]